MTYDEQAYLASNPDIAAAVARGDFKSGADHYNAFGQYEGRSGTGGTSGAQTNYWDSADWAAQPGNGGGTRASGIQASTTPVNVASNLPGNASFYNAPAQFEGQDFDVGLSATSWANVQKAVAGGMDFNEAVIRNSGDGIGTRVVMPGDSGYLPYGIDVVTGQPVYGGGSGASTATPRQGSTTGAGAGAATGLVGGAFQQWGVTAPQTVQSQAAGIANADGTLMQQARGRAMQAMNERGLVNSTLAIQAGQDAVLDRAIQIAQQDAATNAEAAKFNAGQSNAWTLAQQELAEKASQFTRELAAKYDLAKFDLESRQSLAATEREYQQQLATDKAFQDQYQMYVDALFKIDSDPELDAAAKTARKQEQLNLLKNYAAIRGLNLSQYLTFSTPTATAPAPAPAAATGLVSQADNFGD